MGLTQKNCPISSHRTLIDSVPDIINFYGKFLKHHDYYKNTIRISFVGGGTDLREYYKEETGRVLNTGIDKYVYVIVKGK